MNTSGRNDSGRTENPAGATEEIRGRAGERLAGQTSSPGGGGSRERVAAKGNDITREDDLLQQDIEREVNDALEKGQQHVPDSRERP